MVNKLFVVLTTAVVTPGASAKDTAAVCFHTADTCATAHLAILASTLIFYAIC